jgi:hypothetical protein
MPVSGCYPAAAISRGFDIESKTRNDWRSLSRSVCTSKKAKLERRPFPGTIRRSLWKFAGRLSSSLR